MYSIAWWHFQMTLTDPNPVFKVTAFLKSNISNTARFTDRVSIEHYIGNHTQSIEWYHFQWSWVTSDSDFKVTTFLNSNIRKRHVLKTKLLLHKRKVYLTYWMVLCLVTFTDPDRVARICQHQLRFLLSDSAATQFRWGGWFYAVYVRWSFLFAIVKPLLKLDNNRKQRYRRNESIAVIWYTRCACIMRNKSDIRPLDFDLNRLTRFSLHITSFRITDIQKTDNFARAITLQMYKLQCSGFLCTEVSGVENIGQCGRLSQLRWLLGAL